MKYFDVQPTDRVMYDRWKITTEDWNCQWEYKDQYRRLFVPRGYTYDGASIPRIAWSRIGLTPDGEIRAASLAHDVLYRAAGGRKPEEWRGCKLMNENGNTVFVSRQEADWLFYEFCVFATIPRRRARIAWLAVRLAGWKFWGKNPPSGIPPVEVFDG